ncbi:unnamed protein product [Plutella xylostella]|uniref:(diamondback moth) hypothetical protein n=1 Tax=Plutella xylostella TaxID=51655 RepID=A0A8S4E301_PLUXY|nr:unnamed protein product [Plutella xylostella]
MEDIPEHQRWHDPRKSCFVPGCKNDDSRNPNVRFFYVRKGLKQKWCSLLNRNCPKRALYCCEDHINIEDDTENYEDWISGSNKRPRLKLSTTLKNIPGKNIVPASPLNEASLESQCVFKVETTLPDTSPRVLPVPVSQKEEAASSLVYNAHVPATSAGLRCAECGGAVAGRVFACVQCAGAGMCAACGGGAGGRHRRHAVLRLPSRRIYNKVRDLFETLQKEFAKLGLDDASDDESLNSDDDEVPFGNDDDDDEEESKDWKQSLTVPVTSSPSRKRKRKTKSYASTAPKDKYSNITDDTDVDEPLVLVKQPPLDDNPDPLSEVKIEPDEPPEETAAGVITEDSVVKSGIISEVPTTVQTNKGIKDSKKDSVKTKRRSGLNKVTMESHLTTFKKAEIIVLYEQNIPISEIARRLMISRRTVQLWVHRYRDSGHVDSSRRGRKPTATYTDASPRHREIVAAHSADPFCSTRSTATAHNISLQTVRVHLRAAGMRCRKVAKKIV